MDMSNPPTPDQTVPNGEDELQAWGGMQTKDPEEQRVLYQALDSFYQYAKTAHYNTTHVRRQGFYALPQSQWQLLSQPPFNILKTFEDVDEAIDCNAELANAIYKYAALSFAGVDITSTTTPESLPWTGSAKQGDLDKARSTVRQFYRDWSSEGAKERETSFGTVMRDLVAEKESRGSNDKPFKVLVPGAGLARLVFDLCRLGFDTEGNEISYHMLMASSYILNACPAPQTHKIHPWVHSFSNHRTRSRQLASALIPDIHASSALPVENVNGKLGVMSMSASDFIDGYSKAKVKDTFDAVATVFFIDTAPNFIRYIETIRNCLKDGGIWTNFGPLLWHWEDMPRETEQNQTGNAVATGIAEPGRVELTEEEVVALITHYGFKIEKHESEIPCGYIANEESMLRNTYYASHWVARKLPVA